MTENDATLSLGQPVTFSHTLGRHSEWVQGEGTVRTWLPTPLAGSGVIVGWRTLSNGTIEAYRENDGYGNWIHVSNEWRGSDYFRAYLVAFDLRSKPIFVLPEHVAVEIGAECDVHRDHPKPCYLCA